VRRAAAVLLGLAAFTLAVGCGSGGTTLRPAIVTAAAPTGHPCRGAAPPRQYAHVVVVVLENHPFAEIAGHSPYLNGLARACGLATDYTSVAHPSLPNYLALTSGSTHGITSDCTDCTVSAPSLFGQLRGHWRSYLQSIPAPGFEGGSSGEYAKKHNPAAYYVPLAAAYANRAVPLSAFRRDLAHDTLRRFSLVVPDLCADEHDCPIATGDAWLQTWLPRIFTARAYRNGTTVVFVTYDEGTGTDNRVYTVVVAPSVRPHTVVSEALDHYSLLLTVERLLRLRCLADACAAHSMARPFRLRP
jgi:phosphatidylinositol-3-phosphatase